MAALLGLFLAACASTAPVVSRYDFGLTVAAPSGTVMSAALPGGTVLAAATPAEITVTAPPWLDTPAVVYRLAYADESQLHTYAQTQWVSTPSHLLELALKSAGVASVARDCGAAAPGPARLEVQLQEFSQVFDTPQSSHVVLRARVRVLVAHARAVLERRDVELRAPAPSPDGPGAVHGLRDVARAFAASTVSWAGAAAPCAAAPAGTAATGQQ